MCFHKLSHQRFPGLSGKGLAPLLQNICLAATTQGLFPPTFLLESLAIATRPLCFCPEGSKLAHLPPGVPDVLPRLLLCDMISLPPRLPARLAPPASPFLSL